MPPAARRLLTLSAFLLAAVASGCSRHAQPTAPQAQDSRLAGPAASSLSANDREGPGFYPLTVGSSWRLRGHTVQRLLAPGSSPQVLRDVAFEVALDLTCVDSSDVIERFHEAFETGELTIYRRYHESRDGLWLANGIQPPAACAGSGTGSDIVADAPPEQIQLLRYPLHPGQRWVYQNLGTFQTIATVEAHETLASSIGNLPAWRIRLDNPFFKPGRDHMHVWYGRMGYMGLSRHIENDVIENGVPMVITSDETHTIESIQLADAGRFSAVSSAGSRDATLLGRAVRR